MKILLVSALAIILSTPSVWAQSLKPEAPAPLQQGINKSTVDNIVGPQYWYFTAEPGECRVHATLKPMTLLGNPSRCDLTISLYDTGKTWRTSKVLSSDSKPVDCTITGQLKKPTKVLVSVSPPSGGLVRIGGDYELEVTGAVAFAQASTADPVIGMYKQMCGFSKLLGDCKFLADGTIQTTSGATGDWSLFDKGSQTYVINIKGEDRHSLQFIAGRGLVDEDKTVVFQLLR
jgi:hypothetical protein